MRVQRTLFMWGRLKRYTKEHSLWQGQNGKKIHFPRILKKLIKNILSVCKIALYACR